jgi:hypothetical protein
LPKTKEGRAAGKGARRIENLPPSRMSWDSINEEAAMPDSGSPLREAGVAL